MRKARLFSNCVNRNKGFSFVETLISLLIISLISTVMYSAFSSSIKSIIKIKEKQKKDFEIFRTEQELRNIVSSIDIPFWEKNFYFKITDDSISCSYLNGNPKVETKNLPYPINLLSYNVVYFEKIKPVGVKIEYEIMEQPRIISQTFASQPIGLCTNE